MSYVIIPTANTETDHLIKNSTLKQVHMNEETIELVSTTVHADKKSDQIRLCGDFKSTISRYIVTEQYSHSILDDVILYKITPSNIEKLLH